MITKTISLYRSAYSGLSRDTWWLSVVMVINRSGTMVVPFMTMYMTQHLGVSISRAGFVMSLFGLGAIAGALIGGRLTDKLGFYRIQIATLLGGGLMFIILGQMRSYNAICICTFLLAFINEAFRPANSVAVAYYSKEENRTRSYSLNRLAINLGWGIGGGLGGLLASFNYELLFWVDGITNIGAAILLFIVLSPSRISTKSPRGVKDESPKRSAYTDYRYLAFIVLVFFFAMSFFQLFTTIPVFYKQEFHLDVTFIGLTMSLNGFMIVIFEMVTIFKLEGKRPLLQFISFGVFLLGVSYWILNIKHIDVSVLVVISILIATIGEILSMPFMNSYWISRTHANNRGQYAALYTVAWASAQSAGPLLGGLVAEHYGFDVLWYSIGGLCCLLSVAYLALRPSHRLHRGRHRQF